MNKSLSALFTALFMFPVYFGMDKWCDFSNGKYVVNPDVQYATLNETEDQRIAADQAQLDFCETCTRYLETQYGRSLRRL